MPINLKTVQRTAELARLDLTHGLEPSQAEAAVAKLADELAGIVCYIDVLSEADTQGVELLYSPMLEVAGDRPDVPRDSGLTEDILGQAPDRIGDFFAVPKII